METKEEQFHMKRDEFNDQFAKPVLQLIEHNRRRPVRLSNSLKRFIEGTEKRSLDLETGFRQWVERFPQQRKAELEDFIEKDSQYLRAARRLYFFSMMDYLRWTDQLFL